MKLFVVVLIAAMALAEVNAICSSYADFKKKLDKKYATAEDLSRQKKWQSSCSQINAHNALHAKGQVTYQLEDNFMADLTDAEKQNYMGAVSKPSSRSIERIALPMDRAFPATVNLTTSTCMPAIKNQASCGACWAFTAVNPIEYQLCNKTGKLTLLSEQQLVSCSSAYGNAGCGGGWYDYSWKYIYAAGGLTSSAVSPYTATASACTFKNTTAVVNLMGYSYLFPNETMIQQAVYSYGPVAIGIWVNNNFQLYSKGIYKDPTCIKNGTINHAITLVGYGTDAAAGPFWIARNQWGTGWGQRGYMQMARGVNQCGLANYADLPIVYA